MIRSKKAQEGIIGEKMVFYVASVLVLTVILLFMISMISTTRATKAKIPEGLENFIFIQRFFNSPYCFTYQDEDSGRYYRSIIDWSKFNEENLNYCYDTENKNVKGFRLKLINLETDEETTEIKTENWINRIAEEREKNVRIYKKGEFYEGKLIISIQDEKK